MNTPKEVLILEDEEIVREVLTQAISQLDGVKVWTYSKPNEALAFFRVYPRIALVITDFRMPGMDGIEFAKQLRDTHAGVPIVCVTGYMDALYDFKIFDGFLRKPFELEEVQALVRKHLSLPASK